MNNLKEWASTYYKFRKSFGKFKLIEGKTLILEYKDKKEEVICNKDLSKVKLKPNEITVTNNSLKNQEFLIKNWTKFLIEDLRIIFVNLETNFKWMIHPYIHDRVCEKKHIEKSIFSISNEKF